MPTTPTFKQVYALLARKGPGRAESTSGTLYRIEALNGNIVGFPRRGRVTIHEDCWYRIEALNGNIVGFPRRGRVTIHEDCWGQEITCQGTRAGGIYNGPYSIYDWYRGND
jgi:hypothetical protein